MTKNTASEHLSKRIFYQNTDDPTKPKPGEGANILVGTVRRTIEARCLPFFSLLAALGNPR